MGHDVFISHSSKDKTIADATCAALEASGVRCWVAPRDILPGVNWGEAIIDAIAGSRVILLILSNESNVSQQVIREVERGVNKGIPIIPLRVQDIPLSKSLEYFLSSAHWLDAYSTPFQQHLDALVACVHTLLSGEASRPAGLVPPRPGAQGIPPKTAIPRYLLLGIISLSVASVIAMACLVAFRSGSSSSAPGANLRFLGIAVTDLPEIPARHFGVADGGVWVSSVLPEQKADICVGDIITEVDGSPVRSKEAFNKLDIAPARSQPFVLTIKRGGASVKVPVSQYALAFDSPARNQYSRLVSSAPYLGERERLAPPETRGVFISDRVQSCNGAILARANDGAVAAWRGEAGKHVITSVPSGMYTAGGLSSDGRVIVLARKETGELLGLNAITGKQLFLCEGDSMEKTVALLFRPDGAAFITIGENGTLKERDVSSQQMLAAIDLREVCAQNRISWSPPQACFASPQGRYLMTQHLDACNIWDRTTKQLVRSIRPGKTLHAAAPSPDWKQVGIMLEGGTVEVWNAENGERLFALRGHVDGGGWNSGDITFLAPGYLVSVYQGDSSMRFWDLGKRVPIWQCDIESPLKVCHDATSRDLIVASGSLGHRLVVFQVPSVISLEPKNFDQADPVFVPVERVSQPVSTTTAAFGDGRTREIVDLEDGSKMVTERDAAGTLIGMGFLPGPRTVGLGLRLGGKDGADLESHMPFEGGAAVLEVVAGGQAARDGVLQAGDVITAVAQGEGTEPLKVDGLRLAELQKLIMGSEGTAVHLQVLRDGSSTPVEVIATRGGIQAVRRKAVRSDFTNSIGMEFVVIPAGIGFLGIDGDDADMKRHYVRISKGYLIGAHEVTQSEFATVMKAQPSAFSLGGQKAKLVQDAVANGVIPHSDTAHHPVENVSWEQAVDFCKRLSEKEGRKYRLPTEAEWEWSCRNGGKTEWKSSSLRVDWIDETSVGTHVDFPKTTHPVGSRSPNDGGIYDMFGNVAEWCTDNYTDSGFASAQYVDPKGPQESLKRVVRGGSFTDFGFKFFTRSGLAPAEKRLYVGFRVVIEAELGMVDDPDRSRTLLETKAFSFDEKRIPDPLPPVDPPLRTLQEEAEEFKEVVAALSTEQDLQAWRTRLKTAGFFNQTQFANFRGPWAAINTHLGNLQPAEAVFLSDAAHIALNSGDSSGVQLFQQAAAKDSMLGFIANDTAWALATNANAEHRDPPFAIDRAIDACNETKWQYWGFLDTLAASLAADGRHEAALRVAEAALARAPVSEKAQLEHAIERFRKGQDWSPLEP